MSSASLFASSEAERSINEKEIQDIRDTGCINMHKAGKAKSSTAACTDT